MFFLVVSKQSLGTSNFDPNLTPFFYWQDIKAPLLFTAFVTFVTDSNTIPKKLSTPVKNQCQRGKFGFKMKN